MPPHSTGFEVEVSPTLLTWVRETGGWSIEELAKRLRLSAATVRSWESGEKRPTYSQLQALAKRVRRPVATLLLQSPPPEPLPPPDLRSLPGRPRPFSPRARLVFRRARHLQEVARDLAQPLGVQVTPRVGTATLSQSPESVAQAERDAFGISIEEQRSWGTPYEALAAWRAALEAKGILVFQFAMPLEDARGFSLVDESPFVIVVNSSETVIPARIFTLFHEYAHILLRQHGVCIPIEHSHDAPRRTQGLERWCDRLAAEFLLPRALVAGDFRDQLAKEDLLESVDTLSKRYSVSKHALLLRMRAMALLSEDAYDTALSSLRSRRPAKAPEFAVPPEKKCKSERGQPFVSLVVHANERGVISTNQALDYLSLKLRYFERLKG